MAICSSISEIFKDYGWIECNCSFILENSAAIPMRHCVCSSVIMSEFNSVGRCYNKNGFIDITYSASIILKHCYDTYLICIPYL